MMPRPEQPRPYPGDLRAEDPADGDIPYRRVYLDALRRPMTGKVTITGKTRHVADDDVVVPAPVEVVLDEGVLAVKLPPDTYELLAELHTAEGRRITDRDTITLER